MRRQQSTVRPPVRLPSERNEQSKRSGPNNGTQLLEFGVRILKKPASLVNIYLEEMEKLLSSESYPTVNMSYYHLFCLKDPWSGEFMPIFCDNEDQVRFTAKIAMEIIFRDPNYRPWIFDTSKDRFEKTLGIIHRCKAVIFCGEWYPEFLSKEYVMTEFFKWVDVYGSYHGTARFVWMMRGKLEIHRVKAMSWRIWKDNDPKGNVNRSYLGWIPEEVLINVMDMVVGY